MNHTQEPWEFDAIEGSDSEGWAAGLMPTTGPNSYWHDFVVAYGFGEPGYKEIAEANARRIVACVNALAGVENPDEYIASIRAATLKEAADRAERWQTHLCKRDEWPCEKCRECADLRAAIEGETK